MASWNDLEDDVGTWWQIRGQQPLVHVYYRGCPPVGPGPFTWRVWMTVRVGVIWFLSGWVDTADLPPWPCSDWRPTWDQWAEVGGNLRRLEVASVNRGRHGVYLVAPGIIWMIKSGVGKWTARISRANRAPGQGGSGLGWWIVGVVVGKSRVRLLAVTATVGHSVCEVVLMT